MFKKILVPLDGSRLAECVIPCVEEMAKSGVVKEVILFRACDPISITSDYPPSLPVNWEAHVQQMSKHMQNQCSQYLTDVEKRLRDAGINVRSVSTLGDAAKEIVDYVTKNSIDLVVVASHGRSGIGRWAFGSVAEKIFRSCCVPVLMLRAPGCVEGV